MYFNKIQVKSDKLYDYLYNLSHEALPWVEHFGFDAFDIDLSWREKDKGLAAIHSLYPIKRLGLLRIPPNCMYDWHVDEYRLSTVNMLIKHSHSHCLFGLNRGDYYINTLELDYKPNTYYLFNNQEYHSVVNFCEPRYCFSLYFEKELDYQAVKQILNPIISA